MATVAEIGEVEPEPIMVVPAPNEPLTEES